MVGTSVARDGVLDAALAVGVEAGQIAATEIFAGHPVQSTPGWRWRIVDESLAVLRPSRFERLLGFLIEYNKY
jgi:hypothetical protein